MARPELELIDVIDERCAAFFALGHARASGRLVAVVCTSGTAPAHWYPALIEASESSIPLLFLSADRPTELMGCGAPQTIDQSRLFGGHVRFFADLGDPEDSVPWLRHVDRTMALAIDHATGLAPGPVHVNVRARKPLETSTPLDATDRMAERVALSLSRKGLRIASRTSQHDEGALDELAERIERAERPLVVVGPLPAFGDAQPIAALAERVGAPLVAEWGSQLRRTEIPVLGAFDLLLEADSEHAKRADLLVQFGGSPTASVWERWITDSAGKPLPRVVIGNKISDAAGMAEVCVLGDAASIATALHRRLTQRLPWADELRRMHGLAASVIATELKEGVLSEGAAVRAAMGSLPSGGVLVLGNSLPIRLADRYAQQGRDVSVVVQRGVNGIDGMIAGALGAAHATQRPTLAILGDVTALHDVGSLALCKRLAQVGPLTLLVLDNGGGRIFEQLPLGRRRDLASAMPHFATEHQVDLAAVARGFGLSAERVERLDALAALLNTACTGVRVIVAEVPPHGAYEMDAQIRAQMTAVVSRAQ